MNRKIPVKPIAYVVTAIILIYAFLGFFLVPYAGRKIAVTNLSGLLNRPVKIKSIRFNPFTLTAAVNNLSVEDSGNRPLLSVEAVRANLSLMSLFRFAPVLTEIRVDSPQIFLGLNRENRLNISDIIEGFAGEPEVSEPDKEPFQFQLSNLSINKGGLIFSDQVRGVDHKLEKFNLAIPLLTSMKGETAIPVKLDAGFYLNGAKITVSADSTPFDSAMSTRVRLFIPEMSLSPYTPYLPLPKALVLESAGRLSLDLDFGFDGSAENSLAAEGFVRLHDLNVTTSAREPLFSCPLVAVETDTANLLGDKINLGKIIVEKPELHLSRMADGQLRIITLLGGDGTPEENSGNVHGGGEKGGRPTPFGLELAKGMIKDARVTFRDMGVTPEFGTTVSGLDFMVENLVVDDQVSADYDLGFVTESDERVSSSGHLTTGSGAAVKGRLSLKQVVPEKYLAYYRPFIGDRVNINRIALDTGFDLSVTQNVPGGNIGVDHLTLSDIRLKEKASDKPAASLKDIRLANIKVDLDKQYIAIDKVRAGGRILLHRDKNGKINMAESLKTFPVLAEKNTKNATPAEPDKSEKPGWAFNIGALSIEDSHLEFSDLSNGEPVNIKLSDISLNTGNISTEASENGHLTAGMQWQDKGKISIKGEFNIAEPAGIFDLSLDDIDIRSFQPYFTNYLKLIISRGSIQSKGRLAFSLEKPDMPEISFTGQGNLVDFATRDKITNNDFFKCRSLFLSGMDVSVFPVKLVVEEIALTDFYKRATLTENGRFNDREIFVRNAPADASGQSEENDKPLPDGGGIATPEINIGTITLQGGHVNFNDHLARPNYTANMTEIAGRISGLSTTAAEPADIVLKGIHGRHSPLDISGRVDPFSETRLLELAISFKNIELPEFNTYSMKYLGYEIEKGKLMLDLKYNINGNDLSSSNRLFFDQFTLGNQVESENATSLPLELAISLMKNSRGEIDLDLPVEGKLDDPEFSYGKVLATTFQNLILNVIKAPFKFLGSLFGSGMEELGYVEFSPGSEQLNDKNREKLDRLISMLEEKEDIDLEIRGQYDAAKDEDNLRKTKYDALIASYLPGDNGSNADTVISEEMRISLIETAYEAAEFPKPRKESGREKEIGLQEKEKLLFTSIEVQDSELRRLAKSRSENIRDYILGSGKIEPARIFIHDPDRIEQEADESTDVKTLFRLK